MRLSVFVGVLALCAASLLLPSQARAQDIEKQVSRMNKKAMEDYDSLEFESARKTLIDAVAILSKMPHTDCITKQANTRNPFLRGVIRAAGYIPNAGGQAIVDTCAERLRRGRSLVLFPEGTRSPLGELGPFQRGAAHIALASGCPLLPVVVTCEPQTLMRGQKWYEVPDRPFEYTLRVADPISVRPYLEAIDGGLSRGLAARRLTAELRETFEKALRGGTGSRAA